MTGPISFDELLAAARSFNVVDLLLVVFLLLYALDGMRRGFIAGALGLISIVGTIVAATLWYQPVATVLGRYVTASPQLLSIAGFVLVLIVAQVVLATLVRLVLTLLRPVRLLLGPLNLLDHLLGIIPGLIQAAFIAALILAPLRVLPLSPSLTAAIDHSVIAGQVAAQSARVLPELEQRLGQAFTGGQFFRSQIIESDAEVRLPARQNLQLDPDSEAQMLRLVNDERRRAGLAPLQQDDRLREAARQHSEEMFRLGYFSHDSPRTGSPFDRISAAARFFLTSGENIAYAPTVEIAHNGLMNSPSHRKNILAPEFRNVGIGVVSAGIYGRMFTQDFDG